MCYVERRKLSEVLTMYALEPEIKDIYVEGITDKLSYSDVIDCANLNIIEIDSIDFSELYETKDDLKRNNRKKLIELSNQLNSELGRALNNVCCVVDTDFDFFSPMMQWNSFLKYTDYTSLEMYFFNRNTLENFFTKVLYGFPIEINQVLQELTNVLKDLFFIRLALKNKLGISYKDLNFIDVKNSLSINRRRGVITFNPEVHIQKILNSNNLMSIKVDIVNSFNELKNNEIEEVKLQIRGHDYIHVLFLYVDKIKNNINLNEDTLERFMQVCACKETLKNENLIIKLNEKYSA